MAGSFRWEKYRANRQVDGGASSVEAVWAPTGDGYAADYWAPVWERANFVCLVFLNVRSAVILHHLTESSSLCFDRASCSGRCGVATLVLPGP